MSNMNWKDQMQMLWAADEPVTGCPPSPMITLDDIREAIRKLKVDRAEYLKSKECLSSVAFMHKSMTYDLRRLRLGYVQMPLHGKRKPRWLRAG